MLTPVTRLYRAVARLPEPVRRNVILTLTAPVDERRALTAAAGLRGVTPAARAAILAAPDYAVTAVGETLYVVFVEN